MTSVLQDFTRLGPISRFADNGNSDNSRSPTKASAIHQTIEVAWSMRLSRVFDQKWLLSTDEIQMNQSPTVISAKNRDRQQRCRAKVTREPTSHSEHCEGWENTSKLQTKVTRGATNRIARSTKLETTSLNCKTQKPRGSTGHSRRNKKARNTPQNCRERTHVNQPVTVSVAKCTGITHHESKKDCP